MTDFADHLQAALGANYRLDRELIGGGMSRVFVAVDSRDGHLSPNLPLWVSLAGTATLANVWEPNTYTAHEVAVSTAIAFCATAGIKVLKEFLLR